MRYLHSSEVHGSYYDFSLGSFEDFPLLCNVKNFEGPSSLSKERHIPYWGYGRRRIFQFGPKNTKGNYGCYLKKFPCTFARDLHGTSNMANESPIPNNSSISARKAAEEDKNGGNDPKLLKDHGLFMSKLPEVLGGTNTTFDFHSTYKRWMEEEKDHGTKR